MEAKTNQQFLEKEYLESLMKNPKEELSALTEN